MRAHAAVHLRVGAVAGADAVGEDVDDQPPHAGDDEFHALLGAVEPGGTRQDGEQREHDLRRLQAAEVGERGLDRRQPVGLLVLVDEELEEHHHQEGAPEGQATFDAIFEVFPEVKMGDLTEAEVEKISTEVTDDAIDKTIDILRKQRRTFAQRAADAAAQDGDRVTVDFEGKLDGEPFDGGKAEGFQFLVGEGQMLKEFEDAVRGMKTGESKTFPLAFPEEYHGKDVAGKTADFLVTLNKIEAANLPEINDALVKSLGIADGTVEALRSDIKKNLEREVKFRLLARNKAAVMDALLAKAELDLPNSSVQAEIERLKNGARADLKQHGVKDADKAEIPDDIFRPQAERRVRLGLVVSDLVRANELYAKPEQLKAHIDELAASYEKPEDVVRWYFGDRQRLGEVEAVVIENNVADFVLSKAKVTEKALSFDELMGQG